MIKFNDLSAFSEYAIEPETHTVGHTCSPKTGEIAIRTVDALQFDTVTGTQPRTVYGRYSDRKPVNAGFVTVDDFMGRQWEFNPEWIQAVHECRVVCVTEDKTAHKNYSRRVCAECLEYRFYRIGRRDIVMTCSGAGSKTMRHIHSWTKLTPLL